MTSQSEVYLFLSQPMKTQEPLPAPVAFPGGASRLRSPGFDSGHRIHTDGRALLRGSFKKRLRTVDFDEFPALNLPEPIACIAHETPVVGHEKAT